MSFDWSDDNTAILQREWEAGTSASQIAALLSTPRGGPTRNAVIGKIHRLEMKRAGHKGLVGKLRPKRSTVGQVVIAKATKESAASPAPFTPRIVKTEFQHLSVLDLRDGLCRWPQGGDKEGEPITFCGCDCAPDRPYCSAHAEVAYSATPKVRNLSDEERARRSAAATRMNAERKRRAG